MYTKNLYEKIEHLNKVAEKRLKSLSTIKTKVGNLRQLEEDKKAIQVHTYELDDIIKHEITSTTSMIEDIRQIAYLNQRSANISVLECTDREFYSRETKIFKDKAEEYSQELEEMKKKIKVAYTIISMKENNEEKLESQFLIFKSEQKEFNDEISDLKSRLHEMSTRLIDINARNNDLENEMREMKEKAEARKKGTANTSLDRDLSKKERRERVEEIIAKFNTISGLMEFVNSKIEANTDRDSLLKTDEMIIDKIDKLTELFEEVESIKVKRQRKGKYNNSKGLTLSGVGFGSGSINDVSASTSKISKANNNNKLTFPSSNPRTNSKSNLSQVNQSHHNCNNNATHSRIMPNSTRNANNVGFNNQIYNKNELFDNDTRYTTQLNQPDGQALANNHLGLAHPIKLQHLDKFNSNTTRERTENKA